MKKLKIISFLIALSLVIPSCGSAKPDKESSSEAELTSSQSDESNFYEENSYSETESESETDITSDTSFSVRSAIYDAVDQVQTDVSVQNIFINENLGTEDEADYIALIYLSFDVKNKADTAKKMLDLLNNEIGYNMANVSNISEFTIFWQIPYLDDSGNTVAKANLLRNSDGFYFFDEWYDSSIF